MPFNVPLSLKTLSVYNPRAFNCNPTISLYGIVFFAVTQKYYAVASTNIIYVSSDYCQTWQVAYTGGGANTFRKIVASNNILMAVGSGAAGGSVLTSTNGTVFTDTAVGGEVFYDVCYSGEAFYVVGQFAYRTLDGIAMGAAGSAFGAFYAQAVIHNGTMMAVVNANNVVFSGTSYDNLVSRGSFGVFSGYLPFAYNTSAGKWIFISSNAVWTSTDAITWTSTTPDSRALTCATLTYFPSLGLVVGITTAWKVLITTVGTSFYVGPVNYSGASLSYVRSIIETTKGFIAGGDTGTVITGLNDQ